MSLIYFPPNFLRLLLLFIIYIYYDGQVLADAQKDINLPQRYRTEGQITLMIHQNDELVQHHLIFSESIDSIKLQSAILIGYITHTPTKYYKRANGPIITVSGDEFCGTTVHNYPLVPEISWFADLMLPSVLSNEQFSSPHNIGPTGLLMRLLNLEKLIDTSKINSEGYNIMHRYVNCTVSSRKFHLQSQDIDIHLESYKPHSNVRLGNSNEDYFSFEATATFGQSSEHNNRLSNVTFVLDYLDFQPIDKDSETMGKEFHLPLGRGCSDYLNKIEPKLDGKTSFSMDYELLSTGESIQVAFDDSSHLLEMERDYSSKSIWLLNNNLLIHLDRNTIKNSSNISDENWKSCAILNVQQQTSPILQPKRIETEELDILHYLLGTNQVAFLGRGSVRDLPCYIYETIVMEPPPVFAISSSLASSVRTSQPYHIVDYIVQLYLLQGADRDSTLESGLLAKDFKPLQMVLLRRYKISEAKTTDDEQHVEELETIEIRDFSWSLDNKIDKLFKVHECFGSHAIETEQVQLEVATSFSKSVPQAETTNYWSEFLWPLNERKLELILLNDLLGFLGTNRLHLVDYELKAGPSNSRDLDVSMILADWFERPKKYTKSASGKLSKAWLTSRQKNIIQIEQQVNQDQETCLIAGSHIINTSLVVYCNKGQLKPICSIVQGLEQELLVIKKLKALDQRYSDGIQCVAYKLDGDEKLGNLGSISNVLKTRNSLQNHKFEFEAETAVQGVKENWRSIVRNFDSRHDTKLKTIDNYSFSEMLHRNDSMHTNEYKNLADCMRVCNLDVTCKSYSFCQADELNKENKCAISSLDIDNAKVQDQLNGKFTSIDSVIVNGEGNRNYSLTYSKRCKIYERNYLDIFRETDEIIRLKRQAADRYKTKAKTTFECAKLSSNLEMESDTKQVTMFAYCASEDICIIDDDNLFGSNHNSSKLVYNETAINNEVVCRVYRKQYQSFYHVSARVLKKLQDEEENGKRQVELNGVSVEECARVCWSKFGEVCSSFDYCQPGSCLINQVEIGSDSETEIRSNCLHYDRDLKLDQLRQERSIARQQFLSGNTSEEGLLFRLCVYIVTVASVVIGLKLGSLIHSSSLSSRLTQLFTGKFSCYGRTNDDQDDLINVKHDNPDYIGLKTFTTGE